MSKIENIKAKKILDSKGKPTVEVSVTTSLSTGVFSVPSGASAGKYETALVSIDDSIEVIEGEILDNLKGVDVSNQKEIDSFLVSNREKFGGNSLIGVSVACAKAAAESLGMEVYEYLRTLVDISPLYDNPYLFMVLVEGGKHGDSGSVFQEYQIVPLTRDVERAYEIGEIIKNKLHLILGNEASTGYEGGFVYKIDSVEKPFEVLRRAIKEASLDEEVVLSTDIAASEFYKDGKYCVDGEDLSVEQMFGLFENIIKEYDLRMIEDPFEEEDFSSFSQLLEKHPDRIIVGDDLTTTNTERIKKAIDLKSINAVIIKPNQIGTLTQTLDAIKMARDNDIKIIVSHRGGETMDDFISDLVYAFGCYGLKSGAPGAKERDVKYERLIKITKS